MATMTSAAADPRGRRPRDPQEGDGAASQAREEVRAERPDRSRSVSPATTGPTAPATPAEQVSSSPRDRDTSVEQSPPRASRGTVRGTVRSGDLGARIAAAAADLLDETGSQASVTLRGVARRAGVSAPAIYGHYPDVQAIFLVVVREAFDELTTALQAALQTALQSAPHAGQRTALTSGQQVMGGAGPQAPLQPSRHISGAGRPSDDGDQRGGSLRGMPPTEPPVGATLATARLQAVCDAYLDFAQRRPQRYRLMFGGLWTPTQAIASDQVKHEDVAALGQEALQVFVAALSECVEQGVAASDDVFADAVALWLGLHGLAHQRVVTAAFPWPSDIQTRVISSLAHLHQRS